MLKNVGNIDRVFRILLGVAIFSVGYIYSSWWGIIGVVPIAVGLTARCPIFSIFGWSTCKVKDTPKA